jgi:hypothetical protein
MMVTAFQRHRFFFLPRGLTTGRLELRKQSCTRLIISAQLFVIRLILCNNIRD